MKSALPSRSTRPVNATSEDTAGNFSMLEADQPIGFGPPLHVHRDAAGQSSLTSRIGCANPFRTGAAGPLG
jgi:hypothetical protein